MLSLLKMEISEETFITNLGTHIRQLRESKNLSQQDLANDCNIPKVQVGRIERAEINTTIRTLIKIANALQIEPKELLNFQIK
jgi:transcriptional regulator with XRE-family HTH domain